MSLLHRSKWVLAIAGALVGSGMARAATFSSSANAATARLAGVAIVSTDALSRQGSAGYSQTGSAATLDLSGTLFSLLNTSLIGGVSGGLATTGVTSNGTTTASGTVTLAKPSIGFDSAITLPFLGTTVASLFGIDAGAITSTSTVTSMGGVLTATGLSSITNLQFSGLASPLALLVGNAYLNPAANLSFSLGNTLSLTLNEQIRTATADSLGLETNALHLSLNGYQIGGTALTGDVILGHSAARIAGVTAAVPEPASWALMVLGFGLIGGTLRGARRAARPMMA